MACKFLFGKKILQCGAPEVLLVPSRDELSALCEADEKAWCQCRIYREKTASNHSWVLHPRTC